MLADREFDLVIVGAGMFGACATWDAALRGLSVALVEKGDFCEATSANHFKIVHGGIRYLQHLDIYRIRESSRERNALLRIAPHLVQPLPIAVPTYGHGIRGKEFLALGFKLYDLIVHDRNKGIKDPKRKIPGTRIISRKECIDLFPGIDKKGLTGAGIFYDGQFYNPPRIVLSFIRSASKSGAQVANYVEATDFLLSGDRIHGVRARDVLSGDFFDIQGKVVLNAAGPWAERLLASKAGLHLQPPQTYSRDACFVVSRKLTDKIALAVQGRTKDPDAVLSRKKRHLFLVPWRGYTLVGVWHVVFAGTPDEFTVTEEELQVFLDEVNEAFSYENLTLDDVSTWNAGLVLFGENKSGQKDLSYGKRSIIVDHAVEHKVEGLITLIGVRATTARGKAEKAVELVFKKLGKKAPVSSTNITPIYGGNIGNFKDFLRTVDKEWSSSIGGSGPETLVRNYGSKYREVLKYAFDEPSLAERVGSSNVLKAEVVHAVREEMAQRLADVVLRRTELGTGGYPGKETLDECANIMAKEIGWDRARLQNEIQQVEKHLPVFGK
jgi:glycerol-3-phosphate dehydrogenase